MLSEPENHRLEFENLSNYRISFDLYDTGLSVCKTNVLKNYHENFDYTNERQYLDGLLASEVLAETVFLYELPTDRYGVNVLNPQLLLRANLDALRGYIENLMNFDPNSIGKFKERFLQANEPNSFYSPSVQMDYDCNLGINSIVMENSKLGSQSRFSDCILGTNCSVGAKTQVHLSLLSQEVQVGSNCLLRNCYIGKGVRIHDDCRLVNCRIEQNTVIDQGAKFEGLIIKGGKDRTPFTGTAAFRKSLLEDDDELDFNEPEKVSAVTVDPAAKLASFNEKVKEFIFGGDEEGDDVRKISKDVSNLKLDMNIEYSAWISTTTKSIFDLIRAKTQQVPAANKPKKWDEIIETWKPMWEAFQTEASRIEILKAISESWTEERVYTVLNAVVLAYKHDIVSKDSVISWYENRLEESLKPKFTAFYETLLKEDSDSDDESDDDSSDSDSKSSS